MANLHMVVWRDKTMALLLLILIYQAILVKSVAIEVDQNELGTSEFDGNVLYENDGSGSGLNKLDDSTGLISVSGKCSEYGIDNLPHPRFILLGPTGVGKSTLANQLLGRNPYNQAEQVFSVGHGVDSHTIEITYVVGNWLGDGPCFTIIDTPGTSDSEGRDYEHALAMANIMKDQIKSVDIFLLCFNGGVSRFDQSTIDLLKLYESIFSKELWNHAVTEVTYWKHDRSSVRDRRRNRGMNEKKRHSLWNSQYKQELGVTIDIPSVYIDPVLPIFDAEELEYLEEREIEAFKKYTDALWEAGNNSDPFLCDGNCKAPNGYFLGNPWIKTNNISEKQGENAAIKCQIWNGMKGKASENVIWTHNGEIVYEKTTINSTETTINSTDKWGSNVNFVEMLSPGEGHYTDFIIEFESLEETMEGNYTCENGMNTEDNWAEVFMIVDGTWGEWGAWGKCSISCLSKDGQMGHKKRVREAVAPRNGGNPVNPLDAEDTQICAGEEGPNNPIHCPIDFYLTEWSSWSKCSQDCGEGVTNRVRSCNQGYHGGKMCPPSFGSNLSEMEERKCKIKECPKCIRVSDWQEWSECSKTCLSNNPGTKKRLRKTKEADPDNPKCNPDDHYQERMCNTSPCPIDFVWNQWTDWSQCSPGCGKGTKYRMRFCNQGSHGGKMCPPSLGNNLSEKQEKKCKTKDCPDCILHGWQEWSSCSEKCVGFQSGTGTRTRQRITEEADPKNPKCNPDDHSQREICNSFPCPVDGGWTPWSSYGPCSASCGSPSPTKTRSRSCTQPVALYGGKSCDGPREDSQNCNTKPCPVDGRWASWSSWNKCSATCAHGKLPPTQSRTRNCTEPQHGGEGCPGKSEEYRNCNAKPCPVDGGWASFGIYGPCSATCRSPGSPSPTRIRTRSCTEPAAQYGGKPCMGDREDSQNCNTQFCPVDGKWTRWTSYGSCSATCGSATKKKTRTCSNPPPQHNGKDCPGPEEHTKECGLEPCGIIRYKTTNSYSEIWNDHGSGGKYDVSIWRPSHSDSSYCALGDVATSSFSEPTWISAILVDKYSESVAHPTSFTRKWHDGGSGARWDGSFWAMIPPSGYRCLGGAAMYGYSSPDTSNYCCVKNKYAVKGSLVWTYNDRGTGARQDGSLWTIETGSDSRGLEGGNFLPGNGHNKPLGGYLLKVDEVNVKNAD